MSKELTEQKVETPFGTFDVWLSTSENYGRLRVVCYAALENRQDTYKINGREYEGYSWLEITESRHSESGAYVSGSSWNTLTDSARKKLADALGPTGVKLLNDARAKRVTVRAWLDHEKERAHDEAQRAVERAERTAKAALEEIGF